MRKYHGKDLSTNDFTEGYKNKIDRMIEGTRGYSNYEIAVQNGFTGTEAEWLESIKGDKGDKGETGEVSLEQLEKATKTTKTTLGEILTIEDACSVGSKLDISGNSEQETRSGYNLLNYDTLTSKTINGITYTINDDKSITANGTATANATLNLIGAGSNFPLNLEAGDYILSGCVGGSKDTYMIEIYNGDRYLGCANGSASINFSEDTAIRAYIAIRNGLVRV